MSKLRNLYTWFVNPIKTAKASVADLVAFGTDVVQRLIANNPDNYFSGRIATLSAAVETLRSYTWMDESQLGVRKHGKLAKDEFRESLGEAIRPIYGYVLGSFNDPSPEMSRIFPKGRRIFTVSRDDALEGHLQVLVEGLTDYQSELGTEVVADATDLLNQWTVIYQNSESATGGKTTTEAEKREARSALETELFLTMADIILLNPEEPGRFSLYMQQHLLGGPPSTTPSEVGDSPEEGSGSSTASSASTSTSVSSSSIGSSSSAGSSSAGSSSASPSAPTSSASSMASSSGSAGA